MTKQFVRVLADIDCVWTDASPVYRVYVSGELFAERTWIWRDCSLEEMLQIEAEPGDYELRWELTDPEVGQLQVSNVRVDFGPGTVQNNSILRILHES